MPPKKKKPAPAVKRARQAPGDDRIAAESLEGDALQALRVLLNSSVATSLNIRTDSVRDTVTSVSSEITESMRSGVFSSHVFWGPRFSGKHKILRFLQTYFAKMESTVVVSLDGDVILDDADALSTIVQTMRRGCVGPKARTLPFPSEPSPPPHKVEDLIAAALAKGFSLLVSISNVQAFSVRCDRTMYMIGNVMHVCEAHRDLNFVVGGLSLVCSTRGPALLLEKRILSRLSAQMLFVHGDLVSLVGTLSDSVSKVGEDGKGQMPPPPLVALCKHPMVVKTDKFCRSAHSVHCAPHLRALACSLISTAPDTLNPPPRADGEPVPVEADGVSAQLKSYFARRSSTYAMDQACSKELVLLAFMIWLRPSATFDQLFSELTTTFRGVVVAGAKTLYYVVLQRLLRWGVVEQNHRNEAVALLVPSEDVEEWLLAKVANVVDAPVGTSECHYMQRVLTTPR